MITNFPKLIIDNAKNAGYHDIIEVDWQQVV